MTAGEPTMLLSMYSRRNALSCACFGTILYVTRTTRFVSGSRIRPVTTLKRMWKIDTWKAALGTFEIIRFVRGVSITSGMKMRAPVRLKIR